MAAAKANKETIIGVGSGENRKWKMKSMVESLLLVLRGAWHVLTADLLPLLWWD